MTIVYSRRVAADAPYGSVDDTARHVRAHLSSVTSPDDSTTAHAHEVHISYVHEKGGTTVTGRIDREPTAPYLRDDFNPEQDVADNPLSVPSILEGQ